MSSCLVMSWIIKCCSLFTVVVDTDWLFVMVHVLPMPIKHQNQNQNNFTQSASWRLSTAQRSLHVWQPRNLSSSSAESTNAWDGCSLHVSTFPSFPSMCSTRVFLRKWSRDSSVASDNGCNLSLLSTILFTLPITIRQELAFPIWLPALTKLDNINGDLALALAFPFASSVFWGEGPFLPLPRPFPLSLPLPWVVFFLSFRSESSFSSDSLSTQSHGHSVGESSKACGTHEVYCARTRIQK